MENLSVIKIVTKVISFPLNEWKYFSNENDSSERYEYSHLGRTVSLIKHETFGVSLWYDGTEITNINTEAIGHFYTLKKYSSDQREQERLKRIEKLAEDF
jgi:hypothetical protein